MEKIKNYLKIAMIIIVLVCPIIKTGVIMAEETDVQVSLTASKEQVKKGDTFQLILSLDKNCDSGIVGLIAQIEYDTSNFQLVDSVINEDITPDAEVYNDDDNEGIVGYAFGEDTAVLGNGELLTVTFKVKDTAAAGDSSFSYKKLQAASDNVSSVEKVEISGNTDVVKVIETLDNGEENNNVEAGDAGGILWILVACAGAVAVYVCMKFGKKRILSIFVVVTMVVALTHAGQIVANADTAENVNPIDGIENSINIKGSDSVGNLLGEAIASKMEEVDKNNGYNVYSAEVTGNNVELTFDTVSDSILLVALYDENREKVIATGKEEVSGGEKNKTIQLGIDIEEMPEYFVLRAYMLESETLNPLSTMYENPNYTREMQEFLSKTTDDFEEERVLNFDEDKTNNFAVYSDNVIIVSGENNIIVNDENSNLYKIENPSDSIADLQADDIFVYENNGEVLIVKVASIEKDGGSVVITGKDTTIDEVFDYVKIDETAGMESADIDEDFAEEGVTYKGLVNTGEEVSSNNVPADRISVSGSEKVGTEQEYKKTIGSGKTKIEIEGSIKFSAAVTAKIYTSFTEQYIELKVEYSAKAEISLKGNAKAEVPLIPFCISPCPGVYFEFTPTIIFEISVDVNLNGTLSGQMGFKATGNGIEDITQAPTFETEFTIEGKVFFGISFKPEIKIIDKHIASASMSATLGVEIVGEIPTEKDTNTNHKHTCKICIDGEMYFKADLSFKANISTIDFSLDILNKKIHIADFYYSVDKAEFGWGECPESKYLVYIGVYDENGNKIEGAMVKGDISLSNENGGLDSMSYTFTDTNGRVLAFMQKGKHKITISKEGYKSKTIEVNVEDTLKSYSTVLEARQSEPIDVTSVTVRKNISSTGYYVFDIFVYYKVNYWADRKDGYYTVFPGGEIYSVRSSASIDINDENDIIEDEPIDGMLAFYYEVAPDNQSDSREINIGFRFSSQENSLDTNGCFEAVRVITIDETTIALSDTFVEVPFGYAGGDTSEMKALSSNTATVIADGSSSENEVINKTFADLNAGNTYNMYVLKSDEADDLLASENILYVSQGVADSNGKLSFNYIPKENVQDYKVIIKGFKTEEKVYTVGDADGDNEISIIDAVIIEKYLAGYTFTGIDVSACDIDGDGYLTENDAKLVKKAMAGYKIAVK